MMRGRENLNDQDRACLLTDSASFYGIRQRGVEKTRCLRLSLAFSGCQKYVTKSVPSYKYKAQSALTAPSANTLAQFIDQNKIRCLVTMSLCFLEAFQEKQKGNITEQEYIHHLFVHCQGVEHEGDDWTETDGDLLEADSFGYSVRCWSLRIDHVKGNSIWSPAVAFS